MRFTVKRIFQPFTKINYKNSISYVIIKKQLGFNIADGRKDVSEMLEMFVTDIVEDDLLRLEKHLLDILLFDRSSRRNIIWATDDYALLGDAYCSDSEIKPELVTGEHTLIIQPRTAKTCEDQKIRVRDRAEVFTPAWICNQQNTLIDEAWFGKKDVFNTIDGTSWEPTLEPIVFPPRGLHSWKRYVDAKRMEIACGEAPYLASRYDATTGKMIPLSHRVGLLDRKLRVVNENTTTKEEWLTWAIRAMQSVYGYEFQGDNLLLARENMFVSFLEYYTERYNELPEIKTLEKVARIISWNLWQMDGMKYVIPFSCKPVEREDYSLFGTVIVKSPCPGCKENNEHSHTGIYCKIMDWRDKQSFRYIDLLEGGKKHGRL